MDKEILETLHKQWLALKKSAEQSCERKNLRKLVEAFRNCQMFKGDETLEEIIALFKKPQAVEFCLHYHFPNITTLRAFKADRPERFGVYIDAGTITLDNPSEKVLIIGRTTAVVNCSELKCFEVVCMHGAKVIINASGWSVVRVEAEKGCGIIRNIKENAIVL